MKKKRLWKNVGLVALSTVMVGGAALAFTACNSSGGGRTGYTISVYVFCGDADAMTNRTICQNWAREYSAAHAEELGGNTIEVDFQAQPLQETYFEELGNQITSGSYPDIIYVSPSQVLSYAGTTILDLTDYITTSQETIDMVNSVWPDSLAFYAGSGSGLFMENAGEIAYDSATNSFYDPSNDDAALRIYGLPKDYSNFGLGYNRNYFSEAFKKAYTTLKPNSGADSNRSVQTRLYSERKATDQGAPVHTGADDSSITYAVPVTDYTNPYTGEPVTASVGDTAAFINIGIPTAYKPFNFYKYETYDDAYDAGDPLAVSTDVFTDGEGYIVTVPGFPGETFEITAEKYGDAAVNTNEDVAYDTNRGNIVLTWAEYGALNWACAYMLNSFGWDADDNSGMKPVSGNGGSEADYRAWFTGQGGVYTGAGSGVAAYNNVYGGEQYEQGDGGNLYVLPWLFSNDATYINSDYTKSMNEYQGTTQIASVNGTTWSWTSAYNSGNVRSGVGNATEDVDKINLDGTTRTAKNQYGINSENFIETYGAFQEYMATWNGHVGQAGDVVTNEEDKNVNGQAVFVMGASLFYGVGTWDVSEYQELNSSVLDLGIMPTAVSNKLSLYAQGRSAYYVDESGSAQIVTYSNANNAKGTGDNAGTATNGGSGDYEQRSNLDDGLKVYDPKGDELYRNQVLRQDKWAGRMDSVGYAVNAHVADAGQPTWLAAAAVDLVMELTVGEQAQITLTYGGAQIPNVVSQCSEYLNYNTTAKDGAFADMITPEGDAQGNDVWDAYYEIALEMASAGMNGDTRTVAEALNGKQVTVKNAERQDVTLDVKYDPQYANIQLNQFTMASTSNTRIAYAMRVLRMINYTRTERDILIRMQTGMNAVRDQTLYTSGTTWMSVLNGTSQSANFLAYINQSALSESQRRLLSVIAANPSDFGQETSAGSGVYKTFYTPAVYCVIQSLTSQNNLTAGR